MTREGGCFCGSIRYRVAGDPLVVTICHCLHCRRTSAAPFVAWAEFRSGDFTWLSGEPARYSTRPRVTRTFCPGCGTQLSWQEESHRDRIDLTVCSFDDPASLPPGDHLFTSRQLPWVELADRLPRHEEGRT